MSTANDLDHSAAALRQCKLGLVHGLVLHRLQRRHRLAHVVNRASAGNRIVLALDEHLGHLEHRPHGVEARGCGKNRHSYVHDVGFVVANLRLKFRERNGSRKRHVDTGYAFAAKLSLGEANGCSVDGCPGHDVSFLDCRHSRWP